MDIERYVVRLNDMVHTSDVQNSEKVFEDLKDEIIVRTGEYLWNTRCCVRRVLQNLHTDKDKILMEFKKVYTKNVNLIKIPILPSGCRDDTKRNTMVDFQRLVLATIAVSIASFRGLPNKTRILDDLQEGLDIRFCNHFYKSKGLRCCLQSCGNGSSRCPKHSFGS